MRKTDWHLLARQKAVLASSGIEGATRTGLLNWIDAIQDAAERDGHPVIFLEDNDSV